MVRKSKQDLKAEMSAHNYFDESNWTQEQETNFTADT
jgi:hypothetical protein